MKAVYFIVALSADLIVSAVCKHKLLKKGGGGRGEIDQFTKKLEFHGNVKDNLPEK